MLGCLRLRRPPLAIIVCRQVKVKERRVQLAADLEATLVVPEEGRAVEATVLGERDQIVRGVDQFEQTGEKPGTQTNPCVPPSRVLKALWRKNGELAEDIILHMHASHLLPCPVILNEAVENRHQRRPRVRFLGSREYQKKSVAH